MKLVKYFWQIQDVQLEDQQIFTCVAHNEFGEQRKHMQVIVTGLLSPVLMAPKAEKMNLTDGKNLEINCFVIVGIPTPKISWYKVGNCFEFKLENIISEWKAA